MHRLWATAKEMNKRDRSHSPRCTRCQHPTEDSYHIFRCSESLTIQTATTHQLRTFLQTHRVAPLMTTVIIHQLTCWYQQSSFSFPFHEHPQDLFLQNLQRATQDQQEIGWSNFLRGRLALSWFTTHDIYQQQRQLSSRFSATSLGPNLVLQLWDISRQFWTHRNHSIHGATLLAAQTIQHTLLQQKITQAYTTQDRFSPQDKEVLFTMPQEERLTMTMQAQLQWYALYQECLNAPPAPTDTPPPLPTALHSFFRRFVPHYFPTPQPSYSTSVHNANPQQPANTTP